MNPEEKNERWGTVSCWLREWRRIYEKRCCVRATIEVILDVDGAIMRAMMSMLFCTTVRDFGNQKKNQCKKKR